MSRKQKSVDAFQYNLCVDHHFSSRYSFIGINDDSIFKFNRKDINVKKLILSIVICLIVVTAVHAQQVVVFERPGVLTDLVSATAAILALPFAAAGGVVVGTAEAAGSLVHGSTTVVVVPPEKPVPTAAVTPTSVVVTPSATVKTASAVIPTTTIISTHGDGTVTTVTRQASAYELGPVIVPPVDPTHRVGPSPHANPYIYRPR